MGWGDEAEAWLRSKLGDEEYEQALNEIRREYGTFAEESPGVALTGEIVGGMVPSLAAMFVPGGQVAGATGIYRGAQLGLGPLSRFFGLGKTVGQRSLRQNVARSTAAGGTQGAIAGAGAAEGDRTSGALTGGAFGTVLGGTVPLAGTGARQAGQRIVDIGGVSPERAKEWALRKLNMALDEESPVTIATQVRQDIQRGVPPAVANVTPGTMALAETVIQRGGTAGRELEEVIAKQQAGSRERVAKQVRRGLRARDFFKEESALTDRLRAEADTLYDQAYAVGEINDPVIMRVLEEPEFKKFFDRAQNIMGKKRLAEELKPDGDPSRFAIRQIYDPQTGKPATIPDVKTLDYIKQGIDAEIDELFKAGKSADARALKDLRTQFVNRLDSLVPEYKAARAQYAGEMEVIDALRLGREEFNKLEPQEITRMITTMSRGERDAFRTGVAQNLFEKIMDPDTNIDAARKLIGSPSMRKSIEAIVESPAQRDFMMAALERETELFKAASRMLAGSPTAKRQAMREQLEARPGVAETISEAAGRSFESSVLQGVLSFFRKGVPDEYYEELTRLLTTGKPGEVAAVVKLLEEAARGGRLGPPAQIGATEAAITGGIIGGAPPAPMSEEEERKARELGLLSE